MPSSDLRHAFLRFWHMLSEIGEDPEPGEYRFAAIYVGLGKGVRRRLTEAGLKDWRFDVAWPRWKVAVEMEGGTWIYGRHNRPPGFRSDCEKYNAATIQGWSILRYTRDMLVEDPLRVVREVEGLIKSKMKIALMQDEGNGIQVGEVSDG